MRCWWEINGGLENSNTAKYGVDIRAACCCTSIGQRHQRGRYPMKAFLRVFFRNELRDCLSKVVVIAFTSKRGVLACNTPLTMLSSQTAGNPPANVFECVGTPRKSTVVPWEGLRGDEIKRATGVYIVEGTQRAAAAVKASTNAAGPMVSRPSLRFVCSEESRQLMMTSSVPFFLASRGSTAVCVAYRPCARPRPPYRSVLAV